MVFHVSITNIKIISKLYPFCINRPFPLYTKTIMNVLSKWEPSQTFGDMHQTQCKKKYFTNIFEKSTAFIKKRAFFSVRGYILLRRLDFKY